MPLSSFALNIQANWLFTNRVGQGPGGFQGNNILFSSLPANLAVYNSAFVQSTVLGAGIFQDFNFQAFVDMLGAGFNASKALNIIVSTQGSDTAAKCLWTPSPTNGLTWFFSGTTPGIILPGGAVFAYSLDPGTASPQALTSSSNSMRAQNTGTGSLYLTVAVQVGN